MFTLLRTVGRYFLGNTKLILVTAAIVAAVLVFWYWHHLTTTNADLRQQVVNMERQAAIDEMSFNAQLTAQRINQDIVTQSRIDLQAIEQRNSQRRRALEQELQELRNDPALVDENDEARYRRSVDVVAERLRQSYCQTYPDTPDCTTQ